MLIPLKIPIHSFVLSQIAASHALNNQVISDWFARAELSSSFSQFRGVQFASSRWLRSLIGVFDPCDRIAENFREIS
jgi:hypothetical protein